MAQQETKKIDTEFGIIEIVNTGVKVYYDYGRKGYMRNAWKDSEGGICAFIKHARDIATTHFVRRTESQSVRI